MMRSSFKLKFIITKMKKIVPLPFHGANQTIRLVKTTLFLGILGLTHFTFSQQQIASDLENSYKDYFKLPRETIHVHLNKTTYLPGEEIWFTAYIYDRALSKPALNTSNVHCGIYDEEGKEVIKQVFYSENGTTKGSFKVDRNLAPGDYYVKAETNWMKNFKGTTPFVQQIRIGGILEAEEINTDDAEYDLQILPEGGYVIADSFNSLGFKISSKTGQSTAIKSGEITDDQGSIITNAINGNWLGMGKFQIYLKRNRHYTLHVTLNNGYELSTVLPKPQDYGISMFVNNLPTDILAIQLNTNSETLADLEEEELYLAIHRDGLLIVKRVSLSELGKTIRIGKDKLAPGINILTLFNSELQPICERLVYNNSQANIGAITTDLLQKSSSKDSAQVQLKLLAETNTLTNLSISVLPEETLANQVNSSVQTTFLLKPYLRNTIENPLYYFKDWSRKKQFELDLLLLTQGWSKYNWEEIFKGALTPTYAFESGFNISGKVINAPFGTPTQITILQQNSENILLADLDRNKNFELSNAFLFSKDSLSISMLDAKGKMKIPQLEITISPKLKEDFLAAKYITPFSKNELKNEAQSETPQLEYLFEDPNAIALENVTVTDNKISRKLTRNNSLKVGAYDGRKIAVDDLKKNKLLSQFIRSIGFKVSKNAGGDQIFIAAKRPLSPPPIIYVDGFRLQTPLRDVPLQYIDEVYFEHQGLEGSGGGTLYIYQKNDGYVGEKEIARFATRFFKEGYQKPKAYFNPKYSSNNSRDYLEYGAVDWKPTIVVDSSGEIDLSIPTFGLSHLRLFIEGVSLDGTLYSEIKTIHLN